MHTRFPEIEVEKPIESVQIVSDGILVRFSDGVLTYYPEGFLRQHIGVGSNQVFLDHDPHVAQRGRPKPSHVQ